VGVLLGVEFPCVGVLVGKQHQHQQEVVHGRWQLHHLLGSASVQELVLQPDLHVETLQVSARATLHVETQQAHSDLGLRCPPDLGSCELGDWGGTSLPSGGLETAIPLRLGVLSNLVWWECAQFIISIYVYIYIYI
jgi:hypothetical protein